MAYDKAVLIEYRIGRAHETAAEARWAYESDHLSLAENRIYYAMFYMLRALALKHDFRPSKHAQLVGWFNKEFVRTGMVDVNIGKRVQAAFDKRQEGDYDDFVVFEKDEAEADLTGMKEFLASVELLVRADAVRQEGNVRDDEEIGHLPP